MRTRTSATDRRTTTHRPRSAIARHAGPDAPTRGRRPLTAVLAGVLAVAVLAACGTDRSGDGPDGPEGTMPLGSEEIVEGEDGATLGATTGAVDDRIEVSIRSADADAATDAPLRVERVGGAYRFASDEQVVTDTEHPFVVGLPVEAAEPAEDLAIAMLLPGEEGHGDPVPDLEDHGEGASDDRWAFRRAFYDAERGLLLTTLHSLSEEGRVMRLVRDETFETRESTVPSEAEPLSAAQSDPTFEMRCHPSDFGNVNFSCGQLDRDAAADLFEKAYEDFTSVGFTDSPNLYRVPESVAIDNDAPWAQEGAYVMTLRACSQAIPDVGDPGHYWGSNGPGSAYVCYGSNVNWKKTPDPPPSLWVEDIIRHETFHGVQSDYLSGLGDLWVTEGTANAAQESVGLMLVARRGDDPHDAGARHAVDEALTSTNNDEHYKAQDFWVWLGQRLNQARPVGEEEGLEYLISFFEEGSDVSDVDAELKDTAAYSGPGFSGLSAAYLDWVRNQAFEKSIQLGPDTLGQGCAYNGTFVDQLATLDYQPDEAPPAEQSFTLGPLNSRVVRFDFGSFVLGPYEALANVDAADTAVKIKFFDAADAGTPACRTGGGSSEFGNQLVQHQARDGSHRHHALVSNTDLSQSHDVTASVGGNQQGVHVIAPGDGAAYDEGDQVSLEAAATGFDAYGTDFSVTWTYEDEQGSTQTVATTDQRESVQVQLPCFEGPLTATASNDTQSASTFVNVSCTPSEETFTFLMDETNSGEVWSDGETTEVRVNPLEDGSGMILVGDTEGNFGVRGYLDFDLSTLPSDLASIQAAELSMFFDGAFGDPFGDFGALDVSHDEYGALDANDYPNSNLQPGLSEVSGGSDPFGNVTVDVTTAVQDAWANRATMDEDVQFVLSFDGAGQLDDNEDDLLKISAYEPEEGGPVVPTLDVTVEH